MALITKVTASEAELEHDYVKVGRLVQTMQVKTYWLILGYATWREYFEFLQDKFGKGKTQLYGYLGTVRLLSEHVDDETLVEMGISRASELKKAVGTTGKKPSQELLAKAVDPKVSLPEFRQAVLEEFHIQDHNEKGLWYDLRGIYLTADEKEEMLKCFDIAKKIDPPIPHTLPAHAQMKEVLFRLIEEFMGAHAGLGGDTDGFNQVYKAANSKQEEIFE